MPQMTAAYDFDYCSVVAERFYRPFILAREGFPADRTKLYYPQAAFPASLYHHCDCKVQASSVASGIQTEHCSQSIFANPVT